MRRRVRDGWLCTYLMFGIQEGGSAVEGCLDEQEIMTTDSGTGSQLLVHVTL